jgi:hypothetical protein
MLHTLAVVAVLYTLTLPPWHTHHPRHRCPLNLLLPVKIPHTPLETAPHINPICQPDSLMDHLQGYNMYCISEYSTVLLPHKLPTPSTVTSTDCINASC